MASPSIFGDYHFQRAVVLITEWKTSGTVGFIINKKLENTLDEILDDVETPFPLYYGGPVDPDNLFFIHRAAQKIPNSIPIDANWFWSGDFNVVMELLKTKALSQEEIRFFLGYSGWSEGQLDDEIELKSWVVLEELPTFDLIITPAKSIWKKLIKKIGGPYAIWANSPENPIHN